MCHVDSKGPTTSSVEGSPSTEQAPLPAVRYVNLLLRSTNNSVAFVTCSGVSALK